MVRIVTDSSACLPVELARELDVEVVPVPLSGEETTSAPTPGDYLRALAAAGGPALVVCVAKEMSAACEAAALAAEQAEHPARVLDSRTAAGGQALVVVAAAEAARSGGGLDEAERAGAEAAENVRLLAVVGSTDQLRRSGRVEEASDGVLFVFEDGQVTAAGPAVDLDELVARCHADRPDGPARLHAAAMHGGKPEEAEQLLASVTSGVEVGRAFVCRFGEAMLVHTGTDVVGLAWRWERD